MAENRELKRLYSDREIGELLKRATELQEDARDSLRHSLSLQEVEQIAAEVGIDPVHLRQAAMELESRRESGGSTGFWGGPFRIDMRRVVEGSLTDRQWEQIVLELRRLTGSVGRVSEIGHTREWTRTMDDAIEHTQVTLSPGEGQTTIQVQKQYRGIALTAYLLTFILTGVVTGIFLDGSGLSDAALAAILGASEVTALAATRTALVFWAKRQRRRLKHMTDYLQDLISQPQSAEVIAGQSAPEVSEEEPSQQAEIRPRRDIRA